MIGISYFAIAQIGAATARPPHLKAVSPFELSSDMYEAAYHYGLFSSSGTPACSMSVRVVCLLSCSVIRRSPARLSRRPNAAEYHSGWTGVPASSVITYSPP
jgi:hypothetical protein